MNYRGPALLAGGIGAIYFAGEAPPNARRPLAFAGAAAIVFGALLSFDDLDQALEDSGGIFAWLERWISGPAAGEREQIHVREQRGIVLAGPGTLPRPSDELPTFGDFNPDPTNPDLHWEQTPAERVPYVIPTTVSFLDPIDGGTLELNFWQRTFPLTIEVQNNSSEILAGVLSLNLLQKFPVADDETRSVLGRQLSIGPGAAARVTFDVPFARGSFLDSVSYVHAGVLLDGRNIGFADFDLR